MATVLGGKVYGRVHFMTNETKMHNY